MALSQTVTELVEINELQRKELAELAAQGDALRRQISTVTQQSDALRTQLKQIRASASWRVMGPYRVFGRMLRRLLAPRPQRQSLQEFKCISSSRVFDASFYVGREVAPEDEGDAIKGYLAVSRNGIPRALQNPGAAQRRPMPGFHPLIYAAVCKTYRETEGEDPLTHYLRAGMPEGAWRHAIIWPHRVTAPAVRWQRILIHAHFHYPDLLENFLHRLASNASPVDLFITTTSKAKVVDIERILQVQGRTAKIAVVPNRGRDIGPLLMYFAEYERYDIVGHLHGKRSPQQSSNEAENWRDFLWTHLIGGDHPMIDVIAAAFAADERLGLVFPEDPNLNHWDMNQATAQELAERLKLPHLLPPHFEFPKGTMFWARPAALRPLADLGWSWDDFPIEPVAPDGTVLHALERMVPFSAALAGFGFKAVHVPHCWRMMTSFQLDRARQAKASP